MLSFEPKVLGCACEVGKRKSEKLYELRCLVSDKSQEIGNQYGFEIWGQCVNYVTQVYFAELMKI